MTTLAAPPQSIRALPLILAGPALVGAALGLPGGPMRLATQALTLPAIIVGMTLLMLPALYIGAALCGIAPRAQSVARSTIAALKDTSIIFLGLTPPLLFLVAASTGASTVHVLGVLGVGLAVVLGLRALFQRLFDQHSLRALALFVVWSLITVGIGGQLFTETMLAV